MDRMQSTISQASHSNSITTSSGEYVVRHLDQLEEFGKYSVIYEITRIETMLSNPFNMEWFVAGQL